MHRTPADAYCTLSKSFAIIAALLATILAGIAVWGADKQSLGLFHDDGIYTVVAKAISGGEGYRIISLPGEPAQIKYPFLYSYLLSILWSLDPTFPGNILLLKSLNIAVLAAIFFFALALYRRVFPGATLAALMFGMLVCINPLLFTYTDFVISDLLFVLIALAALVLSRGLEKSPASVIRLGILGGLACLTRLAAAPLVLAGFVESLRHRRIQGALVFCGIVAIFVAPWIYWISNHPVSAYSLLSYYAGYDFSSKGIAGAGDGVPRHATIIAGNARYLLAGFNMLYLLALLPALKPIVAVLTIVGMAVSRRNDDVFAWVFFLSSLGLLLVWPFHPVRYIAALTPLLVLFLFRGMDAVEHWINSRPGEHAVKPLLAKLPWLTVLPLFLLQGVWISSYLLIHDPQTTRGSFGNRLPFGWSGFEESFAWIRKNAPPTAMLATAYDPMYFLYTGRQAIRPALHRSATYFYPYGAAEPNVGTVHEIKPELDAFKVDFLIIDPTEGYAEGKATTRLMEDLVAAYGAAATLVFTSSDGKHRIYALR